jgi:hypothetical protein
MRWRLFVRQIPAFCAILDYKHKYYSGKALYFQQKSHFAAQKEKSGTKSRTLL